MKILHIINDTILGGAQKVCIDLANKALLDGNEVAVAAMSDGYLWTQLLPEVKQFQLKFMEKKINKKDLKVLGELKKIRKEYKPDIIHLHTTKPGVLGRWVFRKECRHIVYTVHGFDTIRTGHSKFLPVEKFFQKYSGATVPVSKYDEKNIIAEKITKNINTIYNGIDENLIKPASDLPLQIKEKKVVLTIARIAPPKNLKLFVNVAKHFENKDTAFIWIGGAVNKSVKEIAEEYKIPSNVYLAGDQMNASSYINLCDVFVLFSDFEGLPMSIIEAMSQKKAVVASDVGGISELVDDTNGKLIKTEDEAVAALEELLNNDELLKKKNTASYQKYEAAFTMDKMWNSYKKLYMSLLEK